MKKLDLKKSKWLLLVLAVIIALASAAVKSGRPVPGGEYAGAWVTLGTKTAEKGIAPNGEPFSIDSVKTPSVLAKAIEKSGLTGKVTAEELALALVLRPAYSAGILDQLKSYDPLSSFSISHRVRAEEYHPVSYQAVLSNKFSSPLDGSQLSALLEAVLSEYKAYYPVRYGADFSSGAIGAVYSSASSGGLAEAEAIRLDLGALKGYAEDLAQLAPDFASKSGKTFASVASAAERLITGELAYAVHAAGGSNAAFEELAASAAGRADALANELAALQELAASYHRDSTSYMELQTDLVIVGENSAATYEAITARIASVSAKLAEEKAAVEGYRSAAASQAPDPALAKTAVASAKAKAGSIISEFTSLLKEYNEKYAEGDAFTYSAVSFTAKQKDVSSFKSLAAKSLLPLCGLAIAAIILIDILRLLLEKKRK